MYAPAPHSPSTAGWCSGGAAITGTCCCSRPYCSTQRRKRAQPAAEMAWASRRFLTRFHTCPHSAGVLGAFLYSWAESPNMAAFPRMSSLVVDRSRRCRIAGRGTGNDKDDHTLTTVPARNGVATILDFRHVTHGKPVDCRTQHLKNQQRVVRNVDTCSAYRAIRPRDEMRRDETSGFACLRANSSPCRCCCCCTYVLATTCWAVCQLADWRRGGRGGGATRPALEHWPSVVQPPQAATLPRGWGWQGVAIVLGSLPRSAVLCGLFALLLLVVRARAREPLVAPSHPLLDLVDEAGGRDARRSTQCVKNGS